jgi:uncharacterized protein with GYD domain
MAKYLIQASYTAEGLKGLMKDKASGREAAVRKAAEAAGGSVEAFYYSFGKHDAVVIVDVPDNVTAAAFALTAAASGLVRIQTTPLLTVQEVDQALAKKVAYNPPGRGRR